MADPAELERQRLEQERLEQERLERERQANNAGHGDDGHGDPHNPLPGHGGPGPGGEQGGPGPEGDEAEQPDGELPEDEEEHEDEGAHSDGSTDDGRQPQRQPRQPRVKRPRLKPSDFLPKPFNGENNQDPNAFILNFQDYTDLHKLTRDIVILNRFKLCLVGTPRAWLEQAKFKTWKQCKPAFIAKYLRLYSRGVAVTEFRSATLGPDERVSDYVVRIKPIAMYLNYGEEIVRDQLLSALPRSCQEAIIMSEGESLDVVIDKADRWFALKKDKTSTGPAVTFPAMDDTVEQLTRGIRKQVTISDDKSEKYEDRSRPDYRDYRSSSRERGRGRDYRSGRDYDRDYSRRRDYSRGRSYSRDRRDFSRGRDREYEEDRGRRSYGRSQSRDRYPSQSEPSNDRQIRRCYFCEGDHSYLFCRQLKFYMNSKGLDNKNDYSQSETRNGEKNSKGNPVGNGWTSKVRRYNARNQKPEKRGKGGKSRQNFQ